MEIANFIVMSHWEENGEKRHELCGQFVSGDDAREHLAYLNRLNLCVPTSEERKNALYEIDRRL